MFFGSLANRGLRNNVSIHMEIVKTLLPFMDVNKTLFPKKPNVDIRVIPIVIRPFRPLSVSKSETLFPKGLL